MKRKKKKSSFLRGVLMTACVFFGLVFAVMLGGTVYAEYLLGQVNYFEDTDTFLSLDDALELLTRETDPPEEGDDIPEADAGDITLEKPSDLLTAGKNVVNILLVGADYQSGERARSDSMILCTFNKKADTITMTSILRDTYVEIPGYYKTASMHRIPSAAWSCCKRRWCTISACRSTAWSRSIFPTLRS